MCALFLTPAVFSPWGAGGKFIEVVFSFSIASNCTANVYATSLAIQALAPPLQKVPRAVWVLVAFIIYSEYTNTKTSSRRIVPNIQPSPPSLVVSTSRPSSTTSFLFLDTGSRSSSSS